MKRLLVMLAFANVVLYGYFLLVAPTSVAPATRPAARPLELVGEHPLAPVAPAPSCQSVGPLKEADAAHAVAEWLKAAKFVPKERSLEVDAPPVYWVVATRKTAALAARTVAQLRAAGVSDVELVPPPATPGEVQVSLGLYTERARADKRVVELKRFALQLAVVEQKHRAAQWWLDIESIGASPPIDVPALIKAVPAATGVALAPCPVPLPPDPETPAAPKPSKEPSPAPGAAKLPGAPA